MIDLTRKPDDDVDGRLHVRLPGVEVDDARAQREAAVDYRVGDERCETVDVRAGARVLDVAAGNGNASIAAARRSCDVTCSDYVPELLEQARRRAAADRLQMRFAEADVEALPFHAASFDVVLSSFGVMFAPDHQCAAAELARVCRPGGRIGLTVWTEGGLVGRMFAATHRYVAPIASDAPLLWSVREHVEWLFGAMALDVRFSSRTFTFRYRSIEHWIEVFRTSYAPLHVAFESLEPEQQLRLEQDLVDAADEFNRSGDSTMIAPAEYVEIVIDRK